MTTSHYRNIATSLFQRFLRVGPGRDLLLCDTELASPMTVNDCQVGFTYRMAKKKRAWAGLSYFNRLSEL